MMKCWIIWLRVQHRKEILAFEPSDKAEARASYLLEQNNAGLLTEVEQRELSQLSYFDRRISVLKAKGGGCIEA